MMTNLIRRWREMTSGELRRYYTYVLAKAALVVIILLLLWALKGMNVSVVYMKF